MLDATILFCALLDDDIEVYRLLVVTTSSYFYVVFYSYISFNAITARIIISNYLYYLNALKYFARLCIII